MALFRRKKDDVAERLVSLREQIASLKVEYRGVEVAPVPLAEALARVPELVDAMAAGWRPEVLGALMSPTLPLDVGDRLVPPADQPRYFVPFIVATCRDAIVAQLEAALRERYAAADPARLVPSAERAFRLAELAARIRDFEVEEEVLIATAAADGRDYDRREDVDPAAVLAVDLEGARIT